MELEARRFARKVLLIHLALLLLVLLVVAIAVRVLYRSARQQAIQQAQGTQILLTKQTALGIENYYESITNVLNLLQPIEPDSTTQPIRRPGLTRLPGPVAEARRRSLETGPLSRLFSGFGGVIWENIRDKATLLFIVDPSDDMNVVRVIGSSDPSITPQEVVRDARPWLESVHVRSVSPYTKISAGGAHLVVVPMRGQAELHMVTVIPMSALERDVLQFVNRSATTGIILVDDAGIFISSTQPAAVGRNISEFNDPRTRMLAQKYLTSKSGGTETFDKAETLGDVTFKPGMSTIQPVSVLGKKWSIIVSSSLDDVDNVVRPIFRDAILWSGFVMLATTVILVSTSIQLIRGRVRLERMERDVMAREIANAREIQLHWLPKAAHVTPAMQISAVNLPARLVSGDFYNWFDLPDGRTAITIGDVTGHGMAAAFLMATTQLLVRNILPRVLDPGACLEEVNRQLCMQTFNGQFVTLLVLVLDPIRGTMDIASAGHPAPMCGAGDHFEALPVDPQLVLGVESDSTYATEPLQLAAGTSLVLYTDGVIDAVNPAGQRFTTKGLTAALQARFESADGLLSTVRRAVDDFRRGRDLGDDVTIVTIHFHASAAPAQASV